MRTICNLAARAMQTLCCAALVLAYAYASPPEAAETGCLDTDAALEYWRPLRERAVSTELPTDELALELAPCLGSPDPELRDGIGYELYTYWLRNQKLTDAARRNLSYELRNGLDDVTEGAGLKRSFSALILAEIMRSDSIDPFMDDAARQNLLDAAIAALENESDFRGLEPDIGWVHPVAHMADLLWRFALHPETTPEQAISILAAVDSKIAPSSVSYAFNEGDRLARVVSTMLRRNLVDVAAAVTWLERFQEPRSMENWSDAFQSPSGMAELHNTKQFLRALSDQLGEDEIDPKITESLQSLVNGFTLLI